jgi:hypothetical protein
VIEERNMMAVSLMILPGEALNSVDWTSNDYFPIIVRVPALRPLSGQFTDMRNALATARCFFFSCLSIYDFVLRKPDPTSQFSIA